MPLKKKSTGKGKVDGKGGVSKCKTKLDKETVVKEALANVKIWEYKYYTVEQSRLQYRDTTRKLLSTNETLQNVVDQTERDTIEVISYLKKEDAEKVKELENLRQQLRKQRMETSKERDLLTEEYSQRINRLEVGLHEKEDEVRIIQGELKAVTEFRKHKAEMQGQMEHLQTSLVDNAEEHRKRLRTLGQRFFEEKVRLQSEANRRIAKLAGTAHDEAVSNLDERTREVYRENIQLSKAVTLHIAQEESLQKSQVNLDMTNRQLVAEKELSQALVKEKIKESVKHKKQIKQLQDKVLQLEQSLTVLLQGFQHEKKLLEQNYASRQTTMKAELQGLQRRCQLQDKESTHIKRLARRILDQRAEVELFFLEALDHVRKEIEASRAEYREHAKLIYQQKMLAATKRQGGYPLIKTFRARQDTSTSSVYHDMEHAQSWEHLGKDGVKVEISDMTWQHKEQVLRLLFAKMNGSISNTTSDCLTLLPPLTSNSSPLPAITSASSHMHPPSSTAQSIAFLTQSGGQLVEHTSHSISSSSVPPII